MPLVRLDAQGLVHLIALLSWSTENMDHPNEQVRRMSRRWFNHSRTRYEKFLISFKPGANIRNIYPKYLFPLFFFMYDFHMKPMIIRCKSFYTLRVFQKEVLLCFNFPSIYFSNVIFRILSFYQF